MKTVKNIASEIWIFIIWLISVIALLIDRIIMLPNLWRDQPSMQMINEFEHEKERLAKRWGYYIVIGAIYGLYWSGWKLYKLIF